MDRHLPAVAEGVASVASVAFAASVVFGIGHAAAVAVDSGVVAADSDVAAVAAAAVAAVVQGVHRGTGPFLVSGERDRGSASVLRPHCTCKDAGLVQSSSLSARNKVAADVADVAEWNDNPQTHKSTSQTEVGWGGSQRNTHCRWKDEPAKNPSFACLKKTKQEVNIHQKAKRNQKELDPTTPKSTERREIALAAVKSTEQTR